MLNRLLTLLLVTAFLIGGYVAVTAVTLPNVRVALEKGVEPSQTSQLYARDRTVVMSYGKFQHKPVPLSDMPPVLIDALLATEDRRFYKHSGIDPIGVARALVRNVTAHGVHEGGSTLTQQLARNIFLSNERSLQRKVKEALLAIKLEQQLSKDEILELYLNNVYFGEGAYGVAAASEIYFGKRPRSLSKAECALLAGMPQAPSLYSPFSNPDLARKRRKEVLDNLVETDKLSESEAQRLAQSPLYLNPQGQALSSADKAPFFNRYVIKQTLTMLDMDEQTFWQQGLKVYTTLDTRAQRIAEQQVLGLSNAFGRTGRRQQAALLSLDSDGGMIAYVGGKNFAVSQFDRVSQAQRQAGSLFKIFVYTTAMERGISPLTVYKDAPIEFGDWKPENYDKRHHGYMSVAQALAQSNNIIAVKVLKDLTSEAVIQTAQRMGITARMAPNLSLALGSADVSLREMTGAFHTFNNDGVYLEPYAIEKIVDREGRILYQHQPNRRSVLQRTPRDTMVTLMQGVVRFGTGKGAQLAGRPVAGKTGTSDDYRDAWFIGYTPGITTGVWVGNDDNSKMSGITGGSLPARIWRAYMSRVMARMPRRNFDLSYALPIEEKDFFVYNLENLSASEGEAGPEEETSEDIQAETPEDPEGGGAAMEVETPPAEEGQLIYPMDDPNVAPTGPDAAPLTSPAPVSPRASGETRFAPSQPTPLPDRFAPVNSAGRATPYAPSRPTQPVPVPNPHTPTTSRPIVDPLGGSRHAPRSQPQAPQGSPQTSGY